MKKKFLSTLVAGLLVVFIGATSLVSAESVHAEGGIWNHGVGSKYVWSYYSHNGKYHTSTAIGKYRSDSGATKPGEEAQASAEKRWWWRNEAYYSVL
ncbi:TPA: lactococcin 972 family bacteriocin [Staphylococcus pseudintermedius]|uniref:lactococcin 972 family bacteriocin n=1 Tax=Staphylococcus pseudintermedius TaxID=283734 RepID=UPI0019F24B2E|nr:lactococcin 972 family bacteriocin [Staphylococcus pseudintermedius]EGQ3526163.1 lactococcin 972 family bacteriocin [Staphylococcus pseudintermedius]EHD5216314.1 lactococcin 972 family bacteriocin [Staphylococcus pseudintermedius]EIE3756831.1 lactococcin 972 family bacteriocin [Staphylococcus pseudintermedius]EII2698020.1 lactococcin 972 family bacteriocin [Staphylococcus pseudintermedius]EIO0097143.1 lactococcin 972 family bacteriocin [Staphylococcus pseudintermedius]